MTIVANKPEPIIFELGSKGREGAALPDCDVPITKLPNRFLRDELNLPEVAEVDVVRHFTRLSQ